MDWINRFDAAIEYIENNLDSDIEYSMIAKAALCSEYHFSRMFSSFVGISLSEYIRRRRITLAAFDLQKTDMKIIDIAIKYGYESSDSFTRAFKKIHGLTPSEARESSVNLKAYPKISFQITIKGDVEMDYRIEKIDCDLVFVGKNMAVKTDDAFIAIPKLWEESITNGFQQQLIEMAWKNQYCTLEGIVGICGKESSITDEYFDYFMGVREKDEVYDDMDSITIPACTYAVFPNVVEAWNRLYSEWVPTSGYELADQPCIENYLGPESEIQSELWVPIKDLRK